MTGWLVEGFITKNKNTNDTTCIRVYTGLKTNQGIPVPKKKTLIKRFQEIIPVPIRQFLLEKLFAFLMKYCGFSFRNIAFALGECAYQEGCPETEEALDEAVMLYYYGY